MSLKKKVVRNIGFITAAEVFSTILSYFLVIFIARRLGASELGVYAFGFGFAGIFTFAIDFGISYFFIRQVSKDHKNAQKYFGQYALLKLLFCALAMLLPLLFLPILKRTPDVNLIIFLAAFSLFFQNYSYVARNTFSAFQEMEYEAYVRIAERIFAFVAGLAVLHAGYGITAFMIVLVFSNFFSLLYAISLLRKLKVKFSLKIDVPTWKRMVSTSWTFWLSSVFVIIYFQVDTVMLSLLKGYGETGIYNAAYKLIGVVSKIPWIVVLVLFPVMSEAHAKMSKRLLRVILEKGAHLMTIASFPLIVGGSLLAQPIILFMYGEEFAGSSVALQILLFTTLFLFLGNMIGWFLGAINRPQIFAWTTGICLLINVILNALLIPLYSYIGASVATVLTSMVNFLLLNFYCKQEGYPLRLIQLFGKPLLSALVMGGFILSIKGAVHFLYVIPVAAVVYGLSLIVIGGIKKEDLQNVF